MINFRILFLKALKLPTFSMLWSRLFHPVTAEGEKEFLKKLCFVLKRGMFSAFLVVSGDYLKGTNLKKYQGDSSL